MGSALKSQCNGHMQMRISKTKENLLAVGVKTRQQRERRMGAFYDLQITTNTHSHIQSVWEPFWCLFWILHRQTLTHTPIVPSSPTVTHINICIQRADTHPPNRWSALGMASASQMRQRGRGGGGTEYKQFYKAVPAPVSNFILQPQWRSTAVTHSHSHTLISMFVSLKSFSSIYMMQQGYRRPLCREKIWNHLIQSLFFLMFDIFQTQAEWIHVMAETHAPIQSHNFWVLVDLISISFFSTSLAV